LPEGLTPTDSPKFAPILENAPRITKTNTPVDPIAFSQMPDDDMVFVHLPPPEGDLTASTITIQGKYYDFAKQQYPDAKFLTKPGVASGPVSIYSGDEIVGLLMPVRNEGGNKSGGQQVLQPYCGNTRMRRRASQPR